MFPSFLKTLFGLHYYCHTFTQDYVDMYTLYMHNKFLWVWVLSLSLIVGRESIILFTSNRLFIFAFYYRITKPEKTTFHLLHLSLFREYLDWEFSELKVT